MYFFHYKTEKEYRYTNRSKFEFCWQKIGYGNDSVKEGYESADKYRWVCEKCFNDFKEMFNFVDDTELNVQPPSHPALYSGILSPSSPIKLRFNEVKFIRKRKYQNKHSVPIPLRNAKGLQRHCEQRFERFLQLFR